MHLETWKPTQSLSDLSKSLFLLAVASVDVRMMCSHAQNLLTLEARSRLGLEKEWNEQGIVWKVCGELRLSESLFPYRWLFCASSSEK